MDEETTTKPAAYKTMTIPTESNAAIAVLSERIVNLDHRLDRTIESQRMAIAAALASQKELTAQAFSASEKAINESRVSQEKINANSNEFRGQLKDQNETMIPRPEAAALFRSLEEKIDELRKSHGAIREASMTFPSRNEVGIMLASVAKDITDLREFRSGTIGHNEQDAKNKQTAMWAIGVIIAIVSAMLGTGFSLLLRLVLPGMSK